MFGLDFHRNRELLDHEFECPHFDAATGLTPDALEAGLHQLYEEKRDSVPTALLRAELFSYLYDHVQIEINPLNPFAAKINHQKLLKKFTEIFKEHILSRHSPETLALQKNAVEWGCKPCIDYHHTLPNWNDIHPYGFVGLLQRAKERKEALLADPASTEEYFRQIMQDEWYLYEDNFAGITVKDEPSAADFDGMARVNKVLNELTDGKSVYATLFPAYVETNRLYLEDEPEGEWEAYRQYVTEYIEKVQPSMIPYNCYAFMKQGATLENTYGDPGQYSYARQNLTDYFASLSLFREMSQKYDLPFWVTVIAYNHRNPQQMTEKEIAWTVNSSLAYGAKGMQYYTYWSHLDGNPENWDSHKKRGLVTANGTPHDTYYQIKRINENIKTVDDVLMAATSKGVIQFGKNILPLVQNDVLYSYELLNNISGGDSFVGCFDLNGKAVYYIVNNSINAGRQTFKAEFLEKVNVRLTNSEGVTMVSDTYSAAFNLSGGQAILLEVL